MQLAHLVNMAIELQAIPAPTFHEVERSEFMQHAFRAAGLRQVEADDIGNVYAKLAGSGLPPLIVSAHLDTVFPMNTDLSHRIESDRIVGPGIGDNAIALAALIELAHDLKTKQLAGEVWLVATVGEEGLGNLRGMRRVVDRFGGAVSAYLILEGMALGHIYHRGLPVKRFRLAASGRGGHSWIHHGRRSAIHALIEWAAQALSYPLPQSPKTTMNIGRFQGGSSVNSIAELASLEIDLRSETGSQIEEITGQLEDLTRRSAADGVTLELAEIGSRPAGALPVDHPLVQRAVSSLQAVGESQPRLEAGSTDANIPLSLGYPALCTGITRGGNAHTTEEYIQLEPLPRGYQALLALIEGGFME